MANNFLGKQGKYGYYYKPTEASMDRLRNLQAQVNAKRSEVGKDVNTIDYQSRTSFTSRDDFKKYERLLNRYLQSDSNATYNVNGKIVDEFVYKEGRKVMRTENARRERLRNTIMNDDTLTQEEKLGLLQTKSLAEVNEIPNSWSKIMGIDYNIEARAKAYAQNYMNTLDSTWSGSNELHMKAEGIKQFIVGIQNANPLALLSILNGDDDEKEIYYIYPFSVDQTQFEGTYMDRGVEKLGRVDKVYEFWAQKWFEVIGADYTYDADNRMSKHFGEYYDE